MDGTFSSCPALWDQVYILRARKDCSTYPLLFVLLPDCQMTTYRRLFRLVKNHMQEKLRQELAPARMQTDFKFAAIQAIHAEFPNSCFFHYSQAIWRKTQNLGLAVLYKEDPQVQQWIRRVAGLALLPADQVQDAWLGVMDGTSAVPSRRRL